VARNTAAAMAIAALLVQPEALLLFCPSDHHIPDTAAFVAVVQQAVVAAQGGAMVSFGVTATFPSSAYGYIRLGAARPDGTFAVDGFTEKPARDQAEALMLTGSALWNAGIFLCSASSLLDALGQHAPDILQACRQAMAAVAQDGSFVRPQAVAFAACRAESIDYAVMEQHANVAVLPFAGAWSDVGSWNAVAALTPADTDGNRAEGHAVLLNAAHTYVNAPTRPVVAIGTENLLIVDTPDALLVVRKDQVEQVKQAVELLKHRGIPEATTHQRVARPWGWYESVDAGERFQVKRIAVNPGASLSLQLHHHRAEHWIVVSGIAEVTRDEASFLMKENESTFIPVGIKHRLRNPGKTALEIIEVQSGDYLGEDDIVRFEDDYGRG
jgi:mannose-1-phosphate guanylyltransferase/mannose-6-phosphate isomerase